MTKIFLLGANKEIDTAIQVVTVNQIIQMEGYSYDKYVVCEISANEWGVHYKLINLRTKDIQTTRIVRPLKEKFGIGYYYDSKDPQFMDSFEVAILLQQAQQKEQTEQDEAEKERIRVEQVKEIGRKRFAEIFPEDAQAVIVARLKQDESDSQTDYYASSTQRTVILGFSTHKRDIFSEMRKYASNFEGTAHLTEYNKEYEHREKYSMGKGYYLGKSYYHGWIINKTPIYGRERTIDEFSYIAGQEENICITTPKNDNNNTPESFDSIPSGSYQMIQYSEKSVAVFGDTKPIKEILSAMGGRFNKYLKLNGEITAGWIFQLSKEQQLSQLLGLN